MLPDGDKDKGTKVAVFQNRTKHTVLSSVGASAQHKKQNITPKRFAGGARHREVHFTDVIRVIRFGPRVGYKARMYA